MTIQITNPEVEALINQHLRSGVFKDAEDVVWKALQSSTLNAAASRKNAEPAKDLVELFAPLRGLNLDFEADRERTRAGTFTCERLLGRHQYPIRTHTR